MAQENRQSGVSLIEVVLAVGLLFVVVAALVRLGISTLNTSDTSRIRAITLQHANEVLDYARWLRDDGSTNIFNYNGYYYWDRNPVNPPTALATCDLVPAVVVDSECQFNINVNGANVEVWQIIEFDPSQLHGSPTNNSTEVKVTILWDNRGNYSRVETSSILTDWNN